MAKKSNATLLKAQQSYYAERNIIVPETKKQKKLTFIDTIDINKIGLNSGDFGEYIQNINNREWIKNRLKNATL